jgi:UTP--glucose-1-phosphate uridylyltransferase
MIKKAIIPAAGLGTRFLPATKAQPKEMLPIVDSLPFNLLWKKRFPLVLMILLSSLAGINVLFEDHFDRSMELEVSLQK